MLTQELRNFTDKLSGDINKVTQACTTAKVNAGKLIENAMLQVLTKPEDILLMTQTRLQPAKQTILAYHNNDAYHLQRPCETSVSPYAYVGQQPPNLTHLILMSVNQLV